MNIRSSVLALFNAKQPQDKEAVLVKNFAGQWLARRFCFMAVVMFALQGIVALMGAADLVIPDLPSPIPFEFGRSIHLGLSMLWPLIGTIGMVYFFVVEELGVDIYSAKLAKVQFWCVIVPAFSIYATLGLRIGNGREYLEGMKVFYLGISIGLLIGAYNLLRTLIKARTYTPAAVIMTAGIFLSGVFLLPNSFSIDNPVADEAVKFWVVHLWEELSLELTTAGFVAAFFVTTGLAGRKDIEKWLYLEVILTVVTGLYGTGHHYYWIGFPALWLIIGAIFSVLQLVPVVFLVHMTYKGLKKKPQLKPREKLTLYLNLSSLGYHVIGAYLLGFLITVPWINLYMHGTLLTSGHAHLAVFGSLGFLVLGGCYYCISPGTQPTAKGFMTGVLSIVLLNGGLLLMSGVLIIGGIIQTYLWRVAGLDFMEVQLVLKPYLLTRMIGGAIFTTGDLLLAWRIYKVWQETRMKRKAASSGYGNS